MRAALAAVAVALATAGAAGTTTVRSGLFGTVMRGPITPTCQVGVPCSAPAAGAVLVFRRHGKNVARVTVRSSGSYHVRLAPGLYRVRSAYRRLEPTTVRVRAGAPKRVDFSIDTGIR
jgi:hypothetical protein